MNSDRQMLARLLLAGILCGSAAVLPLILQQPCRAELNPKLIDDHLEQQCDWAFYLDVQDINQYLNYKGSTIHPLERVRVSFRPFPKTKKDLPPEALAARVYEEFWYNDGAPVGLRRRSKLQLDENSVGMLVIGKTDGEIGHIQAIGNAAIRIVIDLQFRKVTVSQLLCEDQDYDGLVEVLKRYHFTTKMPTEGKQFSLNLVGRTGNRSGLFFYQRY